MPNCGITATAGSGSSVIIYFINPIHDPVYNNLVVLTDFAAGGLPGAGFSFMDVVDPGAGISLDIRRDRVVAATDRRVYGKVWIGERPDKRSGAGALSFARVQGLSFGSGTGQAVRGGL